MKAFKTFDRNGDGTVQAGEIKHILLNLGDKLSAVDIDELLVIADPTGSGIIDYNNFSTILCEGVSPQKR